MWERAARTTTGFDAPLPSSAAAPRQWRGFLRRESSRWFASSGQLIERGAPGLALFPDPFETLHVGGFALDDCFAGTRQLAVHQVEELLFGESIVEVHLQHAQQHFAEAQVEGIEPFRHRVSPLQE